MQLSRLHSDADRQTDTHIPEEILASYQVFEQIVFRIILFPTHYLDHVSPAIALILQFASSRQSSDRHTHLPEETLPCREVCSFEQSVFKNSFYTSQRLDHVGPVVVQIPEFAVMTLVSPPEWVLFQHLYRLGNNKQSVMDTVSPRI